MSFKRILALVLALTMCFSFALPGGVAFADGEEGQVVEQPAQQPEGSVGNDEQNVNQNDENGVNQNVEQNGEDGVNQNAEQNAEQNVEQNVEEFNPTFQTIDVNLGGGAGLLGAPSSNVAYLTYVSGEYSGETSMYETIAAAIADAGTNDGYGDLNSTITLLKNATLDCAVDKAVSIDLNGKTLTVASGFGLKGGSVSFAGEGQCVVNEGVAFDMDAACGANYMAVGSNIVKACTITIDADNGTQPVSNKVEVGSVVARPENNPGKEGHTFVDWFEFANGQFAANAYNWGAVNSNLYIKAKYTVNKYSVYFKDGETTLKSFVDYDYGTAIVVEDPTKEGKVFEGWEPEFTGTIPAANTTYVAQWADAEAQVDGVNYKTLAEALAVANDKTVKLLANVETGLAIPAELTTTIDLNSQTLTVDPGAAYYAYIYGDLTITGSGNVIVKDYGIAPRAGGKLTVESGAFSANGYYMFYLMGGELEINGGNFTAVENIINCYAANNNVLGGKVTITAGIFTVTDDEAVAVMGYEKSDISIQGGTFNADGADSYAFYVGKGSGNTQSFTAAHATISGGTFNAPVAAGDDAALSISDGNFTLIESYDDAVVTANSDQLPCDADQKWVADGSGKFVLVDKEYVAEIDGQGYETLAAAIDAAEKDDMVVLLTDVTASLQIPADKDFVLDLAGNKLTVNAGGDYYDYIRGSLTIKDSSSPSVGSVIVKDYGIAPRTGGKLTVEGGAFVTEGDYLFYLMGGELLIKSGTFTGPYNVINCYADGKYAYGGTVTIKSGDFTVTGADPEYPGTIVMGFENSNIAIEGGSFVAENGATAVYVGKGSLKPGVAAEAAEAAISGGTFYAPVEAGNNAEMNISGGTFDTVIVSYDDAVVTANSGQLPCDADQKWVAQGTTPETYKLVDKEYVAQVNNGTKYESLQDAVNAAADGDTVTVLKDDMSFASRVDVSKSITIDLNDKTLYAANTAANGSIFNIVSGEVTIQNGTLDGRTAEEGQNGLTVADGICLVTVRSGATLNLVEGVSMIVDSRNGCCVYPFAGGHVNISGGTYENQTTEVYQYNANFKGMTVNQANVADRLINITGGSFRGNDPQLGDDSNGARFVADGYVAMPGPSTTPGENGGYSVDPGGVVTFDTAGGTPETIDEQRVASPNKATKPDDPTKANFVFGGWKTAAGAAFDFDTEITADVALTAQWTTAVASVTHDETVSYFATLQGAVNAAVDGDTVTVLKDDMSFASRVDVEKSITIDLGGKKLYASNTAANGSIFNIVSGTVTIRNGLLDGRNVVEGENGLTVADGICLVTVRSGATLNLGSTVRMAVKSKNGCCVYPFAGGHVNISGGTYENWTDEPYQYKEGFKGMTVNQANVADRLINITGGTFIGNDPQLGDDSNGARFVADGYVAMPNPDGYTVVEGGVVSFNTNGGTPATIEEQRVAAGATATKPATDPEKDGFSFDFWGTVTVDPETGDETWTEFNFEDPVNDSIILQAKWTAASAIKYYDAWSVPNIFYFSDEDPVPSRTTQGVQPRIKRDGESSYHAAEAWVNVAWYATETSATTYDGTASTVATVNETGLVTFTAPGSAKIWCVMTDPSGAQKSGYKTANYKLAPAYIVRDGEKIAFAALSSAINAALDGETIYLGTDLTGINGISGAYAKLSDGRTITVDLNGHSITTNKTAYDLFEVTNGTLNIINSSSTEATITHKANTRENQGMIATVSGANSTLTIGSNVKATSLEGGVFVNTGATLNVSGTIEAGEYFAICGNGSTGLGGTTVNITGGTVSSDTVAIYQPQSGTLNINGTVTGTTAVYVKCGEVNITGGALNGTGDPKPYEYWGSGCHETGDALVVDNCQYPGGVSSVTISGGSFNSTYAKGIGSYAYDKTAGEPSDNLAPVNATSDTITIPEDEMWVANTTTGGYDLVAAVTVTFDAQGGTPAPEAQKIAKGATATKPATDPEKEGFSFDFWGTVTVDPESGEETWTEFDFESDVDESVILTAKWTAAPAIQWFNSWSVPNVFYFADEDPIPARTTQRDKIPTIKREGDTAYHPVEEWVTISWTVTDSTATTYDGEATDIATVDENGLVTFKEPGTVKVWLVMTDPSRAVKAAAKTVSYKLAPAYIVREGEKIAYSSLYGAFNAALDGETVYMGADYSTNNIGKMTLSDGRNITIDLNGYTASLSANYRTDSFGALFTVEKGTLSIINSGTTGGIAASGTNARAFNVDGTANSAATDAVLTIGSGVVVSSEKDCCVTVFGKGTLNTAGVLVSANDFAIAGNGTAKYAGTVINVTGGSVTGDEVAIYHPQDGQLTISGGTISAKTAVYVKCGTVSITGGTLYGTGEKKDYTYNGNGCNATGDALVVDNCSYPGGVSSVTISGGSFNSTNAAGIGSYTGNGVTVLAEVTANSKTITIPADEKWVETEVAGTYKLTAKEYVAQVGEAKFETLAEAIEAADANDTIVLLKDVVIDETGVVSVSKKITLDMDGRTLTYQPSETVTKATYVQPITVTSTGELTITGNGTINGPEHGEKYDGKVMISVKGTGKLYYENGTLTATGSGSDGMYGVYVNEGGTAVFGTANGGPTITSHFAAIGENHMHAPATITVNGGTYTANAAPTNNEWWSYFCAPIYAPGSGSITINGGEFHGYYGISDRYADVEQTLTINGGTFNASSGTEIFVDEVNGSGSAADRTIKATTDTLKLPEGYIWFKGEGETSYRVVKHPPHEFDYENPEVEWGTISGVYSAEFTYTCKYCDAKDVVTVPAEVVSESKGVRTYKAVDHENEETSQVTLSYTVTLDNVVQGVFSWGEICTLSADGVKAWYLNSAEEGNKVADGVNTYSFAVINDTNILTGDTSSDTQQAVVAVTMTTPASGKANIEVMWSVPGNARVRSVTIYRGYTTIDKDLEAQLLIDRGTQEQVPLTVTNGSYLLRLSDLTPNRWQHAVVVITYADNGGEHQLISTVQKVLPNGGQDD